MTIYLFGIIDGKSEHSAIYQYTTRHLRDWFPKLPSYTAFFQKLNKVAEVFAPLLDLVITEREHGGCTTGTWLADSFPVALAKHGHRFKAKVAPELANSGYCSTKKLYYYGVRVHLIGRAQSRANALQPAK